MLEQQSMSSLCSTYGASIFFRRWVATIIDFLIWAGLIGTIFIAVEVIGGTASVVVMIGWFMGLISYYLFLEGYTGYTAGKFFLRIQVVNEQGGIPRFVKSLLRSLVRLIETNPLLFGGLPAGIIVLATSKKQRLGDMAADTYVVKVKDLLPRSRRTTIILSILFSVLVVGSVASVVSAVSLLDWNSDKTEIHLSKDEKFQITVPSDWSKDSDLNEEADISVSNRFSEKYFVALSEAKQDFDGEITLADFESAVAENFTDSVENGKFIVEPHEKSIKGNPAIQFTIKGKVDGIRVIYLFTTLETPTHFHQLIAWTLESRYSRHQDELSQVVESFGEAAVAGTGTRIE